MGVFDINGKFFKTLTKAGDFIILTLLARVCSIPVITIGCIADGGVLCGIENGKG